jgi:hypothetical protein
MEITLKYHFEKGQIIRYSSKTEILNKATDSEKQKEIGTQKASWAVEVSQRILEVENKESAHILYHSMPVDVPPEAQMMGVINKKQVIYVLMADNGKIVEASGIGFQGIVSFPGRPNKEGDSWNETSLVDFPGLPKPVNHTRTFIFKGIQTVENLECAHIAATSDKTTIEVPSPDGNGKVTYTVKTEGEIHFAFHEGILVKTDIDTVYTSVFGNTVVEGNNHFIQSLLEVKAGVKV